MNTCFYVNFFSLLHLPTFSKISRFDQYNAIFHQNYIEQVSHKGQDIFSTIYSQARDLHFSLVVLSKATRPLVSSQMLLSRNVKLILTHAHNVAFSVKLISNTNLRYNSQTLI